MSFNTIGLCAIDDTFAQRARAAYAKEGIETPDAAWNAKRWVIAADPSIEPPYESALLNGNPNPGGDESVITDGMLTAAVQSHPWDPPTP